MKEREKSRSYANLYFVATILFIAVGLAILLWSNPQSPAFTYAFSFYLAFVFAGVSLIVGGFSERIAHKRHNQLLNKSSENG